MVKLYLHLVLGVALALPPPPLLLAPLVVAALPLHDLLPVPRVLLPPLPQDVLPRLVVVLSRLGLKDRNSLCELLEFSRQNSHLLLLLVPLVVLLPLLSLQLLPRQHPRCRLPLWQGLRMLGGGLLLRQGDLPILGVYDGATVTSQLHPG